MIAQWIAISGLAIICLGAYREIAELESRFLGVASGATPTIASRLKRGERLPSDLTARGGSKTFFLMMSYGCSGCLKIATALRDVAIPEWGFVAVFRGSPLKPRASTMLPSRMNADGTFDVPNSWRVVRDENGKWFDALGISATPTVLAAVNGMLVDQAVAAAPSWYELIESRVLPNGAGKTAKEVRA